MFKIDKVEINGFWHRHDIGCSFNNNVNIIIGRNGTGKTTFMNILNSILTVDIAGLSEDEFDSATIILVNESKKRTIKVNRLEFDDYPFPIIEYKISQRVTRLRGLNNDDRRVSPSLRRRYFEQAQELRRELDQLTSVSSLSVYRLRHDDDYEIRDRHGSRVVSPVDYRLSQALNKLTAFQLKLAEKAQQISKSLQRDVLASILYGEDDSKSSWDLKFNKEDEQTSLLNAYTQLNASDSEIKKKVKFHVSAIEKSIKEIEEYESSDEKSGLSIDIKPLEALRKTRRIIELSLEAKNKNQEIYSQIELFLKIIRDFISDKRFSFNAGKLQIENEHGTIDHEKLSSGEKQLIILMIEALLQEKTHHVFLADEPELSLHIAWQRKIIPAVKEINPNSQVIVATHSPEVAAKFRDSIIDMEKVIRGLF